MKGAKLAHSIVKKIRKVDMDKDSLERTLGVILAMIVDGDGPEDIDPACKLILGLRQPGAIEEFLAEMKLTEEKQRGGKILH